LVAKQVGNKVELVGRVTKVHTATTKYGKPYCFVFFNHSRQSVKLNIWSEGLANLSGALPQAWVGKWLSVQGLVDPAYSSGHGTSLSITITSNSQVRTITETEARHRLKSSPPTGQTKATDNRTILEGLSTPAATDGTRPSGRISAPTPPAPPVSKNTAILQTIAKSGTPPQAPPVPSRVIVPPSSKKNTPWGWILFGAIVLLIIMFGR
jgi:hypothetical protein